MQKQENKLLDVRKVTRAVNQNGTTGYKVTIPAEWIRKHKLENGGRIVLLEDGDNLIIQPI